MDNHAKHPPGRKIWDTFVYLEHQLMALIVLLTMLLLAVNIFLRLVGPPLQMNFGIQLPRLSWAEEAIRYSIIWITFIAATNAFRRESHFGVDLIFRVPSVKFVKCVRLLNDVAAFVFNAFIVYYGMKMVLFNMSGTQVSPAMKIPFWMVYTILPISGVMSMAYIARNFIRKILTPAEVLHQINNTHPEGGQEES